MKKNKKSKKHVRRHNKRTIKRMIGGNKVMPNDVSLEIVYSDFFKTHIPSQKQQFYLNMWEHDDYDYKNYFDSLEDYEDMKKESRELFEERVNHANHFNEIIRSMISNHVFDIPATINEDASYAQILNDNSATLCKQDKHSKEMIQNTIGNMREVLDPVFILFLKHNETNEIIGFCQMQIHCVNEITDMFNDDQEQYIEINYLCGSQYVGVGKILISLAKQIADEIKSPIKIESYDTSKLFYEKMGFHCSKMEDNYLGNYWCSLKTKK